MSECYCGYEEPTLSTTGLRKARKQHKCGECSRCIERGEQYEYISSLYDGHFYHHKTCSYCIEFRMYVLSNIPCFCWYHEMVIEQGIQELQEFSHELPGLLFKGYRLLVEIKKRGGMVHIPTYRAW